MPQPDGTMTMSEIMQEMRADACEGCGGPLPPWVNKPRGANDPLWQNSDACSEACMRKAEGKTWPKEEDCPSCPAHRDGPHKFGCTIGGARQIKIPL